MSTGNPYKWRNRLPVDSDMFFGRKREIERIMDMLSGKRPQGVSIVGERRIGKSSMAYRVFHNLKEKDDTLAIYMDCNELPKSCDSDNEFYKLVNYGFKKAGGISEEVVFSDYREFRDFVGRVSKENMKVVIFLDEFEHLPKKKFADNSFFSNLRALADNPEYLLAFVTISKTELKELTHKAIQSSCFYNIFDTIMVGLLDHDSIKGLRTKGFQAEKFKLAVEEKKKISYYAGDFAFFNQLVCAFLWDTKHYEETPEWDDLEVKLLPYYDTLWQGRSRHEQKLLEKLKKENKSSDFDMKGLKVRGLLMRAGNLYYPFSDFFGHLMEERFKVEKKISGEKIVKHIEKGLDLAEKSKKLITRKGD